MLAKINVDVAVRLKPTNKPSDQVVLRVGAGEFRLPALDVVSAVLEHCRNGKNRAAVEAAEPVPGVLPKIGAEFKGGIYAGLTLARETALALVLIPGDEKLNWEDATKWAEKQGGVLPSRIDALVLFQNLKAQFKEEYYWTSEPYAPDSGFAWLQGFYHGNQSYGLKVNDSRARAVRRIAIQ